MPLPRQRTENGEITKAKLLLVEGKDETIFFQAFLKKSDLLEEIQIIEVGGTGNFKTELQALINRTGFSDNVESIAIIRDADTNFDSAFQSICSVLSNNNLCHPLTANTFIDEGDIKIGVFIMPGNSEDGTMLEDLCLKTQSENPIMNCIDQFFQCIEPKVTEFPRNIAKAKAQVFLAAMPKIVSSVGIGAQKNYWNLEHPCLYGLDAFLKEL